MASFSPLSHSFSYTQNIPQTIPSVYVEHTLSSSAFAPIGIQVIGKPAWLDILNITAINTIPRKISFTAKINETAANSLVPNASYTANIQLKYRQQLLSVTSGIFPITINVLEGNLLAITPAIMSFNYVSGQALPSDKLMQISTNNNWTVTPVETWIKIRSNTTGLGNNSVIVGVDPSGMPIGTHNGTVVVNDGFYTRTMQVVFTITGLENENDFLSINPESINFVSEENVVNNTIKNITLESSGNWTTVISSPWINLDVESGAAGIFNLEVSVNSVDIGSGSFSGTIIFYNGDIFKILNISLNVIENAIFGIVSDGLYYAKDRNKIKVGSSQQNTDLLLKTNVSNGYKNFNYTQKAPYFQGYAEIIIGEETELLQAGYIPTLGSTRVQNNLKTVVYSINVVNRNINTYAETPISAYANVKFLKGKNPVTPNKLCYIPENITVTKNAVLSLTYQNQSISDIEITGDITASITTGSAVPNAIVHNAIINLADFNLSPGNNITISFGSIQVNVSIKDTEPEVNTIAFLNEWNEYEFFETTGFLTKTNNIKKTTTTIAVNGEDYTKVVEIDLGVEYTLNTGYIYSQQEVDWLARILENKRFFLYTQENGFVEMDLTTSNLEVYETRNYLKAYTLKFKKATV